MRVTYVTRHVPNQKAMLILDTRHDNVFSLFQEYSNS